MMQQQRPVKEHRHRSMSDGQLAVLLVLPALIVIGCITVFPIMRTLWYSMFDLRLNHPARNDTYLSYSLDLEKYADGMFTVSSQLNKAIARADTDAEKEQVQSLLTLRQDLESVIFSTDARREQLQRVDEMVEAYQPVSDTSLRLLPISKEEAAAFQASIENALALGQAALEDAPEASSQLTKAVQALDALEFALVEPNFIGAENYVKYLTNPRLWTSVANTVIFTIFAVSLELVIGMLLALLMNQNFRGRGLIRASVLIPWSIPASTSATIWKFMYDGQYGVISRLFATLGLIPSAAWILTTQVGSLFGMIVSDIWKTSPFMALLLLAGLQTIDGTLYEAAKVDGSGKIRSFFSITLPLLKPTILVSVLFRTMDTFKAFDLPSVMTNGANNTEFISLYAYKLMFAQMDFGSGSAVSLILFLMAFLICIFYIKGLGADIFKSGKA